MRLLAPLFASALFVALALASPAVAQVRVGEWKEIWREGPLHRQQWPVQVLEREASGERGLSPPLSCLARDVQQRTSCKESSP